MTTYNPLYHPSYPEYGPELAAPQRPRCYTGIGSRRTPAPILATMTVIARYLAGQGWTLRSGGASGADSAFEAGAGYQRVCYRPRYWTQYTTGAGPRRWRECFYDSESRVEAERIAARIHPDWNQCDEMDRAYHTRNVFQVTGVTLDAPSAFVVFWAPEENGAVIGGTRTAVMYARELGIPTFNLLHGVDAFKTYIRAEVAR